MHHFDKSLIKVEFYFKGVRFIFKGGSGRKKKNSRKPKWRKKWTKNNFFSRKWKKKFKEIEDEEKGVKIITKTKKRMLSW